MTGGGEKNNIMGMQIPLINAVLVAIWLTGTTITLTIQWYSIKTQISDINRHLLADREKTSERIAEIEASLVVRTLERWTRLDQQLWCNQTEILNKDFKCAAAPPPPTYHKSGSYNFWNQGKTSKD